ncbi:winged helix-turn-helix transcriptional regulator [Taibaiella chishuiensis]|uniref:HxlR family transcriptional regulator n=1 Tax=Taibaiella chishuiensis TaxID=1434707 RepID=A0A2P8CX76_9BACT|nr:helix-turn-helix domain-containing protein [Taibaiella chishuiensis]PSK89583.1 HxlR family transcriptional regulator [Taibaiella chishuiensis]
MCATSREECNNSVNAVRDALYVLNGKWKLLVIVVLSDGPKRFKEIERAIEGITPKVLSKELRDLELNEFVERKVYDAVPVQISYELTPYSDSLKEIIGALRVWGEQHKKYLLKKHKQQRAAMQS